MNDRLNNQYWPQIAVLRPRLRQHVQTYPQTYRGERWYVLRDESSGRFLRFNSMAYEVIGRLDGEQTLQEILDQLQSSLGDEAPDPDEITHLVVQLFGIDALQSGLPADTRELFNRYRRERRIHWQRTLLNPLALRFPLFDPDRFISRLLPWVRPLFSGWGVGVWLLVVGMACLLALINAPALGAAIGSDILSPSNLVLIGLIFPLIKGLHELGHACAVKIWGGEVHEMGITLLVLMPIPYVDASAAWAFRDRRKRVLVGAAGILVELFVAAVALFLWLAVEPGLVKEAALNAFLIGSVSTLLFNSNPLLRFDGYYILQDLIEIPNLGSRSNRYYLYLIQRYLFGLAQVRSPVTAPGERAWFVFYGFAAFVYRLFILTVITLFLAGKYLAVGVALATWAIAVQIILPVIRGIRFVLTSPNLAGSRPRGIVTVTLFIGLCSTLLLLLPVPLTTRTEGIVWVTDQAQVYAGTDGFLDKVLASPGTAVERGAPLVRLRAPSLGTRIAVVEARRRELQARKAAEQIENRVQSEITAEELAATNAELQRLQERASARLVKSPVAGTFILPNAHRIQGRYLRQGELIGYVVTPGHLTIKTVVPQSDIGLVRQHTTQVEVRLAERLDQSIDAHILRATPSGSRQLPSRALGAGGGGNIAIDLQDKKGTTASEKVFQVELELPPDVKIQGIGERAYVRFDHGTEPLARQWLRSGRQLLLSRLSL
jgi:putative peptide zinc metalloprotease protein